MAFSQGMLNRITKVAWVSSGGLVFIRVSWHSQDIAAVLSASAIVTGLPWSPGDGFDFFTAPNVVDNAATKVDITDPVTAAMILRYKQWAPRNPVTQSQVRSTPGLDVAIIDFAQFDGVYDGHITGQTASGTQAEAEEEMFNALVASRGSGDRSLFGSFLTQVLDGGHFRDIKSYPDPEFFTIFAREGWTYHVETGPPSITGTIEQDAVLILNLAHLQKALPLDPATGKKPISFTFNITSPTGTTTATSKFGVEAFSTKSKVSTPPKSDDGRRTFPVQDITTGTGLSAVTTFLNGAWPGWPEAHDGFQGHIDSGSSVDVKITFGKTPKVELLGVGSVHIPTTS